MKTDVIDWAAEVVCLEGESVCGDCYNIVETADGVLVTVIDGIGHGEEASEASHAAADLIAEDPNQSLSALIMRCHQGLKSSRGAVISMAHLDRHRTMTWAGIGDVEGRLFRKSEAYMGNFESLFLASGIVGGNQTLTSSIFMKSLTITRGDVLVLATDGIRPDLGDSIDVDQDPKQIARNIVEGHRKGSDDALVFVGKYTV